MRPASIACPSLQEITMSQVEFTTTVEATGATMDTAPREVEVPGDLAAALAAAPDARAFFDGLTDSQRKGFVTSVTSAKQPETRARRVDGAVAALSQGRKRP
jgi:uncharacterized protein YdeI (YjbR/CyaY-like superfamily)